MFLIFKIRYFALMKVIFKSLLICILLISFSCEKAVLKKEAAVYSYLNGYKNSLNYSITPQKKFDKKGLMFSDQGAWFAYSTSDSLSVTGFSGPFLMTQQWGVWASKALAQLTFKNQEWNKISANNFNSHLEQTFSNNELELTQKLVFLSGHTALIQSNIKNISNDNQELNYDWNNYPIMADSLSFFC